MSLGEEQLKAIVGDAYDDPVAAAKTIRRRRSECTDDEFVAVAGHVADLLIKGRTRLDLAEELAVAIAAVRPSPHNNAFVADVLEAAGQFLAAAAWRKKGRSS